MQENHDLSADNSDDSGGQIEVVVSEGYWLLQLAILMDDGDREPIEKEFSSTKKGDNEVP